MTRIAHCILLVSVLLLTGCPESVGCPQGMILDDNGGCRPDAPIGDGGNNDAGSDAAQPDAGPCGACSTHTPLCREDGQCVACLSDDECGGQRCDTEAGECVGCLADSDCTQPGAARCDTTTHECAPCMDSAHCEGMPGRGVCGSGECVECTAGESTACGAKPCTTGNTCSSFPTGAQRPCQPCDADENCEAGHFCVPMQYEGADRAGGYCLKSTDGGCTQPFSIATPARTSLSGAGGMTFCGINETLTTCEAVRGLLDNAMCPGGTDEECPEGGICRTVGTLANRCTYECGAASECLSPPTAGSTCASSTGPDYCGG